MHAFAAGDQEAQHFALITKGNKTYAVPVEWFYVFKKHRKEAKTEEELVEEAKAKQQREDKVSRAFNKKFQIKDDPGAIPILFTADDLPDIPPELIA